MKYVAVNRDTRSFQLPLSDIQIQRLTQNAFGEMPLSWQLMTTGKFNTSYRIEFAHLPTCILRVAPSSDVVLFRHEKLLLRRENLVQQQLNKISDKVPVNLYADFSQELIARNYVFQNCLEGELWDAVKCDLTADQNDHLWRSLAPIVRAIHQLEGESFGSPLLKGNYQCWSDAVIDWVAGMVTDMQRYRLNSTDAQRFLELVILGRGLLDDVKRPTLVHGDLWQKNILITRHHGEVQISGILDAERAFWGEPLAEWIFPFWKYLRAFGEYMVRYQKIIPLFLEKAYTRAGVLFSSVWKRGDLILIAVLPKKPSSSHQETGAAAWIKKAGTSSLTTENGWAALA